MHCDSQLTQPTLVLVHGAFHRVSMWDLLIAELPDVAVQTVQLPSSAPVPVQRLGSMYDDALRIRDVVTAIAGPVVVCAHSYGGTPTSQALTGVHNVSRLVYLNAFVLDVGESMLGNRGNTYPPHWQVHEPEGYLVMRDAEQVFYNDLDQQAATQAAAALGPQSLSSMVQPLTQAAWRSIPATYILADQDAGVPRAMGERFAQRIGTVRRMDTGHSPFLSQPAQTAELLREELLLATGNRPTADR
ncbi:alpha/beta hydrolase [Kribbella sp. NPDC058245]|uniref:alpha/beta hydrolase n=1 Tax=Kribbella sp. NPDC058245 TaxID=3346399 RepID=UPI0036E375AC